MARTKRSKPGNGLRASEKAGSSQNRRKQKEAHRAKQAKSTNPSTTQSPQTKKKPLPPHQHHQQPTIPFDPSDRILLIGEGDFSFSHSLLIHHLCTDLTATTNDSLSSFSEKYTPQGPENALALTDAQQTVLYGVDATDLLRNKSITKLLKDQQSGRQGGRIGAGWDVIIFNFPHVGGLSTDVNRQVRGNQELLVKFFGQCRDGLLSDRGTVVVTLFEGEPYSLWNIKDLARHQGLTVVQSFRFVAGAYEGYRHVRTLGNLDGDGGWKGEERPSRTFVFAKGSSGQEKKWRREDDDD